MIYAWSIQEGDSILCVGVISSINPKRAEETIRKDWEVTRGYFSYSIVRNDPTTEQSILLYKRKEE